MIGSEHEVDSERVLELVRDSDCSAYDCESVSVAARLEVKLLTADAKVLRDFPRQTVVCGLTLDMGSGPRGAKRPLAPGLTSSVEDRLPRAAPIGSPPIAPMKINAR